ncbi:hypothetical protein GCM10023195_85200 [Actinoallomurus liliacearum]|uniref:Uncharacterized protein n=1 Tax=Actinoallomurus liliacearum TaxID=1080073 RepID=A0ABP8U1I9_9ACTN
MVKRVACLLDVHFLDGVMELLPGGPFLGVAAYAVHVGGDALLEYSADRVMRGPDQRADQVVARFLHQALYLVIEILL